MELNENILSIFLLLTPILLLFFRKRLNHKILSVLGFIMIICRILVPLTSVETKMIIAGIGSGCFMLFLPGFISALETNSNEKNGMIFGLALSSSLLASILLRTLGYSLDLSMTLEFQWIGWVLGGIAALTLIRLQVAKPPQREESEASNLEVAKTSIWKIIGLSVGMIAILANVQQTAEY